MDRFNKLKEVSNVYKRWMSNSLSKIQQIGLKFRSYHPTLRGNITSKCS